MTNPTEAELLAQPGVIAAYSLSGKEACGYAGNELQELARRFDYKTGEALASSSDVTVGFRTRETVKFSEISGQSLTDDNLAAVKRHIPGFMRYVTKQEAAEVVAADAGWVQVESDSIFKLR